MAPPVRQYSFSGGEISPSLYARTDLVKYETGLRTCRNMIPMRQGGLTGRPGTMFVGSALNGGDPVRLIPFIFNETGLGQSYVVEFGDQYAVTYQDGAIVVYPTSVTITGASQASTCVLTAPSHGFSNGVIIYITGIAGMTQLNNRYFLTSNVATDTIDLLELDSTPVDSTNYDAYISGGIFQQPYIITSPFTQSELASIDYSQSGDVLTLVHPAHEVQEMTRVNAYTFAITGNPLQATGPVNGTLSASGGGVGTYQMGYYLTGINSKGEETVLSSASPATLTLINPPSPTNLISLSWPATSGVVEYRIYAVRNGTSLGFLASTTQLSMSDDGADLDYSRTPPTLNAGIGTSSGNYPAHVGYVQQRRGFANTTNNPIGFWLSRTGAPSNFNVDVNPDDASAVFASIAGEEVNAIEALLELKFMLLLTAGAEFYVQGNGSGVVTPSAINASAQSQYGSSSLRPIRVGDSIVFIQSLGSAIRDFAFDFAIDGYRGNDITVFSQHLFEGYQIVDWAYQKVPDSIVWAVRSDGTLLSCTYVREQQVLAWARHDLQGGTAENVVCIPENGEYAVYLSVKRTINGNTIRYIERLSSRIWTDPINTPPVQEDPINSSYLDCFASYDGRNSGSTTMTLAATTAPLNRVHIVTGTNDNIPFTEDFPPGPTHHAIIAPGFYTVDELAVAFQTAMNGAGGSLTYVVSVIAGAISITTSSPPARFDMNFQSGGQAATAAALGFLNADYSVGTFVTAPAAPGFTNGPFSTTDTAYQEQLTLYASSAFFTSSMLGDQIFLEDEEWRQSQGQSGNQVRLIIESYTSSTIVTVTPDTGTVPTEFQYAATLLWSYAIKTIGGLMHLEGEDVSVWADRFVVGSPLNSQVHPTYTITNGKITLDKPYAVIYVGLPMIQDLESLDLETYLGETILAKRKRVSTLSVYLYNTRSFFCGTENPDDNSNNTDDDPLFELYEERDGESQATYDQPPQLLTEQDYVIVPSRWNKNGRIFMRNVDPVPFSVLGISPQAEDAAPQNMNKRV